MDVPISSITCCHARCGITFWVSKEWNDKRLEDKTSWTCPNGHSQSYTADTPADKLRRENDRLKQEQARLYERIEEERKSHKTTTDRLTATKGVVTKIKRRVGRGICPCCTRTFGNVAAHMQSKHPDYKKDEPV